MTLTVMMIIKHLNANLAQSSQVALKANPLAQIFVPTDIDDLNLSTRKNESNYEHSSLDVTPAVQEIRTPGCFVSTQTVFDDECDARVKGNNALLLEKYISDNFCENIDTDNVGVSQVLKQIRINKVNNVIIGHLNVNFFAKKLDDIKTIILGNVDIMIFSETRLDLTYPMAQLLIEGFGKPFRLDRNAFGGGLLIYVRSDISCKQLNEHMFSDKIKGIFIEINFRKSKWLLLATYHPLVKRTNFISIILGVPSIFILKSMIKFY